MKWIGLGVEEPTPPTAEEIVEEINKEDLIRTQKYSDRTGIKIVEDKE